MPSAGNNCLDAAIWGLLPEIVLTNCLSGLQAADWYEKLERQRGELARQIAEFSEFALVRLVGDVVRLESGAKNWLTGGWHTTKIFEQYNLAVTRGVASGQFLLLPWFKSVN